jgi:LuxR family maltose regulon positive regulatory protein
MQTDAPLSFARTKIQAPRPRADLIERQAVEATLGAALAQQRLTLLLAPAGWGKTSALARQLARQPAGTAVAWISADEDDDVPRLLAALAAALEPLDLPWHVAPSALGALAEAERGLRLVADELVNALPEAEVVRGLVVVDDLHRVSDRRVFELLTLVLERLPTTWGLVLASRTEPALPLSRLRARGELAELRQGDLRFDAAEVTALLGRHGVAGTHADELLRRTEGWAAGLRLLLSVGARGAGTAPSYARHVFDYLADEVLAGMAPALRQFLLRCALLPELTPARCAHVSELPNAVALFEQVEREGLFVTALDDGGRTLRLHDLFRDFLEDRLQRDHAAELPGLLRRAADGEPDLARAVGWLARAAAWDRAAAELARRGPALVPLGGAATIERLLGLFPAAELQRYPDLDYLRGLCAFHAFDFDGLATHMERAATGYTRAGQAELALWARIFLHIGQRNSGRGDLATAGFRRLAEEQHGGPGGALVCYFRAWEAYAEHRPDGVAPAFAEMLELLEALESAPDRQVWGHTYLVSMLAGLPGMAPLLARHDRGATPLMADGASLLRAGVLHSRAARAFCEGRLAEAAEWLANADDDLQWLGRPRSLLTENLMLHLAVDAARGDAAACAAAAEQLRADLAESGAANQRTHGGSTLLSELRAGWALGDTAAVRRVQREIEAATNPFEWISAGRERAMAAGAVALLDGRLADAERLLTVPPGPLEDMLHCRGSHELLLCAEAQRRQGRLDAAAATLRRWFDELRAGGPVGGALLAGAPLMDALAATPWGARLASEDQQRLRAIAAMVRGDAPDGATAVTAAADAAPAPSRPAGLTEREAEVLSLVAQGQSNKLIARALALSPFTVKRHVANILNKAGLATRTEAAAWWVSQPAD